MMAKAITTIATAATGAARLEIVVADITALDLDAIVNAATFRCSAAAGSTARSTAPPVRTSSRNAALSAAAPPVPPRSPAATACQRAT
jgi:hypothetical protein